MVLQNDNIHQSVTGPIYEMDGDDIPTVKLFTKHGCTLCDKVKDVRVFDVWLHGISYCTLAY